MALAWAKRALKPMEDCRKGSFYRQIGYAMFTTEKGRGKRGPLVVHRDVPWAQGRAHSIVRAFFRL